MTKSVLKQLSSILKSHISPSPLKDLQGLASLCKKIRLTIDEGFVDEDISIAFEQALPLNSVTKVINTCVSDSLSLPDALEIIHTLCSIAETLAEFSTSTYELSPSSTIEFVEATQKIWRSLDPVKIKVRNNSLSLSLPLSSNNPLRLFLPSQRCFYPLLVKSHRDPSVLPSLSS